MHAAWIVGSFAVVLAAGAVVLVRTRWLQSRTLEKCVALSVLLHAALGIICALVGGMAPASWGTRDEGRMTMVVLLEADDDGPAAAPTGETGPTAAEMSADDSRDRDPAELPPPATEADVAVLAPAGRDAPAPPGDLVPLLETVAADEPTASPAAAPAEVDEAPSTSASASDVPRADVPPVYADRTDARRGAAALARGGSEATERAVQAALAWLVRAQASDGRWDASAHGAGTGRAPGGQHDGSVGARSDTGVSGLALLAFLGAGTTHRSGPDAATVERGLRFLLDVQRDDGSLAGDAEFFAGLYCHGMATLALAECCALSGDGALRTPLERAVRHTLAAQHPITGGWRYAPGDRGDTSQLGWQVLVLSAARQAGLGGFDAAETGARTFLQGVSSGQAGGLAAYRPGERPSVAMTAEALVCRLFLGMPVDHPAAREALDFIGRHPPDPRRPNAYTWYYATLASFHSGGDQWHRWNQALQAALLPLQRGGDGPHAGSWDPDPVWGGHGGRVYATAVAALTLEVYYRYLPIHQRGGRIAATP